MVIEARRSALLRGTVHHRRLQDTAYEFTHAAWYLETDLDERDHEDARGWWPPSLVRWTLRRVLPADHLEGQRAPLAAAVRGRLSAQGFDASRWRIALVTYPRLVGVLFNPVSFYLCRDEEHVLRHVIAEVSNTHGDREVYDFPRTGDGPSFTATASKRMYVSPFIAADARYQLRVSERSDRVSIDITEHDARGPVLFAGMDLQRAPLTARRVIAALATQPVMSMKTIVLIAWHAVRIRLRGVPWEHYTRRRR